MFQIGENRISKYIKISKHGMYDQFQDIFYSNNVSLKSWRN